MSLGRQAGTHSGVPGVRFRLRTLEHIDVKP